MVGVRIFGLALLTLMVASPSAAAPGRTVKDGVDALRNGNPALAVAIWRPLAQQGNSDAAFDLGQAYRFGRGVAPDAAQAKKWYEQAARAGHLQGQVSLGLLLFNIGDRANALTWLRRAADRGEPRALLITGTALFNGDGIKRDPALGYAYVRRAAAQGFAPAVTTLAELERIMSVDERRLAMTTTGSKAAKTRPAPAPPPVKDAKSAPIASIGGGWRIQLGAFGNRSAAQALFGRLAPSLGNVQSYYIPVGAVTRLQVGNYPSSAVAAYACARLKPQPCFPVAAR